MPTPYAATSTLACDLFEALEAFSPVSRNHHRRFVLLGKVLERIRKYFKEESESETTLCISIFRGSPTMDAHRYARYVAKRIQEAALILVDRDLNDAAMGIQNLQSEYVVSRFAYEKAFETELKAVEKAVAADRAARAEVPETEPPPKVGPVGIATAQVNAARISSPPKKRALLISLLRSKICPPGAR